jgi:hypothetical protein
VSRFSIAPRVSFQTGFHRKFESGGLGLSAGDFSQLSRPNCPSGLVLLNVIHSRVDVPCANCVSVLSLPVRLRLSAFTCPLTWDVLPATLGESLPGHFQFSLRYLTTVGFRPPRGRFSHLAMFRVGTLLFIPGYLTVTLYRVFASPESGGSLTLMMR